MRKLLTAVLATAVAGSAIATELDSKISAQFAGSRSPVGMGGDHGPRGTTIYYQNVGGPYFFTGAVPRWHTGDLISFNPQNNTGATLTEMHVPVGVVAPVGTYRGRVVCLLWNLSDPNDICDPNNGIMGSDFAGGYTFLTGSLTTPVANVFYDFTVNIAALNIAVSVPDVGVELAYLVDPNDPNPGTPHPVFTTVFAQNVTDPNNPDPNADCVDPNAVPTPDVGSSADFYIRDANGNGILEAGTANGCPTGPNELRFFGGCPFWSNFFLEITGEAAVAGCPNPGCDDPGADADFDGNCQVNLTDLGILLANFGGAATNATGDANGDNLANLTDLGILLARFGANCN
jgi:hypothetical protein